MTGVDRPDETVAAAPAALTLTSTTSSVSALPAMAGMTGMTGAAGSTGGSAEDDLPVGVERRLSAPPPLALLLGRSRSETVRAALDRHGCACTDLRTVDVLAGVSELPAFHVLFVGADAVTDDEGVRLVRELHAVSPNARVLLLAGPDDLSPPLLVVAMRAGISDVVDPDDAMALDATIAKVLRQASARADRVLAIGAHPDDVEIGCGGTLLDHRRRGDTVSVFTLSHGAVGGDQQDRMLEAAAAAATMGAELMLADLPDTRLDGGVDTIRLLEAVVRLVDPTIIYTHSRHDQHQDHRSVHTAVISASRHVPQVFAFQSPSATNEFAPTKYVAIDDVVVRKVDLLRLFDSQRDRSYLEPEMVIAAARYWARSLAPRARYAEPFEIVRSLTRPLQRAVSQVVDESGPTAPVLDLHQRTAVDA
ncbi:LmbE family N-acetylglucosaminyl deacetylase [Terracoccus luteus]|uniref:LmbE family N-acetylglucosaminyl deacetylase n=1 Tax=Terracoccus luteus TaxID=53356 RepID=A0A495Y0P1_9MICO|nr:PIG-L deacetylase family protein [Terracoccus luteus]RKT79762.1 LmbE family N-acetylglucosaminyl deacetylase [Terracoccus luteus]